VTRLDFIIIGGGSAGCVLAARLSEDPAVSVLLLEAGESEAGRLAMRMPLAWRDTFLDPAVSWGYQSEPEPMADARVVPVPRGKVLGGTASVNGMMYSRGAAPDYDDWARAGLAGWSYAQVLPYFKRAESNWRGANPWHGAEGPLTVARHRPDRYYYPALIAAARELGFAELDDFHGAQMEGFSTPDFTVHRGERGSTVARYLRPAMSRNNLQVITVAHASRLIIEGRRARGVECLVGGQPRRFECQREVLLAAGSIGSPQLLLLSGVGPSAQLAACGVPLVHALPGVGSNLQDHQSLGVMFSSRLPCTFETQLRADRFALSLLRWLLFRSGPVGDLPVAAQGFVRTAPGLDRPDLQMLVSPVSMAARPWFPLWRRGAGHVLSIACVLSHPVSRGQVSLRSADPRDPPRVQLGLLQAEQDRLSLRRIVRFVRRYFATASAAALVSTELLPGAAVQSDEDIDAYVRRSLGTAMHPVGTCAMGTGPDAVVDAQLRVHGLEGLRVVDASVMPTIIGGNTNAPVIMIAEKAVDMILGRPALQVGA
jgi:choline dehydrogenase